MKRIITNSNSRGYGAILAAVLLFLVCAVGIAVLAPYALRTSQRRAGTGSINKEIFQAIVGNPERGTFGYLGDSGGYPTSLNLLLTPGTNGPLVRDVSFDNTGVMMDDFFGPLEYWRSIGAATVAPTTHGVMVISRGPDHVSSNSSPTPNLATAFVGTNPTVSGYATTPDNLDNMVVPDVYTSRSAINVGYTGTLTYNFTNRDLTTSTSIGACPAAYTMEVISDTRGATMERILAPVGASASLDLVQGFYTMRLLANSNTNQALYTESVAVYPGTTTTRTLNVNSVAVASTPAFSLRITNLTGANLWIYRPRTSSDITGLTAIVNNATAVASVNACESLQARSAAVGGGTLIESFSMSNGITTKRVVLAATTFTYTVTVSTAPFGVVLVGNPGVVVGSVYRLRRKVFTLPSNSRVQVLGVNGASLAIVTSLTSNQSGNF